MKRSVQFKQNHVLSTIGQYGYVTRALLEHLLPYSAYQLARWLTSLQKLDYIAARAFSPESKSYGGSRPNAYSLLPAGLRQLNAAGMQTRYIAVFKRNDQLQHDVRVAEVHASFAGLQNHCSGIALETWLLDHSRFHLSFISDERNIQLTPDGVAIFRNSRGQRFCYLLEYDRGTVHLDELFRRIDNYLLFFRHNKHTQISKWQSVTDFRVILVVEDRPERSRDQYTNLLQYALTLNQNRGSKLFWFTAAENIDYQNPARLFDPIFEVAIRGSDIKPRPLFYKT